MNLIEAPWAKIPLSLLEQEGITKSDIKLYAYLDFRCGKRGYFYDSQELVARKCDLPLTTMRHCLDRLKKSGYVQTTREGYKHKTVLRYFVLARVTNIDELLTNDPDESEELQFLHSPKSDTLSEIGHSVRPKSDTPSAPKTPSIDHTNKTALSLSSVRSTTEHHEKSQGANEQGAVIDKADCEENHKQIHGVDDISNEMANNYQYVIGKTFRVENEARREVLSLVEMYPGIDIEFQLRRAVEYLDLNPHRIKPSTKERKKWLFDEWMARAKPDRETKKLPPVMRDWNREPTRQIDVDKLYHPDPIVSPEYAAEYGLNPDGTPLNGNTATKEIRHPVSGSAS